MKRKKEYHEFVDAYAAAEKLTAKDGQPREVYAVEGGGWLPATAKEKPRQKREQAPGGIVAVSGGSGGAG